MLDNDIETIIINYFTKSATADEIVQLSNWLSIKSNKLVFKEFVKTNYLIDGSMLNFNTTKENEKVLEIIFQKEKVSELRLQKEKISQSNIFVKIFKYAAIFVIVIGLGFLYKNLNKNSIKKQEVAISASKTKILPGTNKAILTLENGSEIGLEKGKKIQLNGRSISDEKLIYNVKPESENNKIQYNCLTIPKGGQFFVQLSDGTKVWLNADSKFKYPISFTRGQIRTVELIYGEAYFEVSKSINHNGDAFKVQSGTQEISVLGTVFNIKAYEDEIITTTTLLEGIVQVKSGNFQKLLKPGQQAKVNKNETEIKIQLVNLEEVVSWKNGYFVFDNENIQSVMNKISRWYNVEIIYQGKPTDKNFIGSISRFENINEILNMLELTGIVNFKVDGRRIIVMP